MKNNKTVLNISTFVKYICLFFAFFCSQQLFAEEYEVISPNGQLKIKLQINNGTQYEVWHNDKQMIMPSAIGMNIDNGTVVGKGTIKNVERNNVNGVIPVLIGKNKSLDEVYSELIVHFNENYGLIVRAYDEGVAYRFQTEFGGNVIVQSETADFNFPGNPSIMFPEANGDYFDRGVYYPTMTNFERSYDKYVSIADIDLNQKIIQDDKNRYANTPLLATFPESYVGSIPYKVVIAESDLLDYPGLYVFRAVGSNNRLSGYWPKYPNEVRKPEDYYTQHDVLSRFDYIAKTTGTRLYPWRIVIISTQDKDLLNNELIYKLAKPQVLEDVSWIKPGITAWEWGSKAILEGVDFVSGGGAKNLSLTLYKYYVDWAAKNNIPYITIDAGWSGSPTEKMQLCNYAKGKKVGVWIWTWANVPVEVPGWIETGKKYGFVGFKVDFFNRDDQVAINWLEQIAKECAEHKMMVLFHGCPKPTGLHRAYPNILNYEAVRGNENNFWDYSANPDYNLEFPFIRMLAGPLDYTPGSMHNVTKGQFRPIDTDTITPGTIPNAMGTRCHQLGMYIIFDHPIGFLVDSPTEYNKYPDILDFLSKVPTVWDKTVPVDAELGKYAILAKQSGNNWYIGGMSNWDQREVDVDFSFLPSGVTYRGTLLKDYNLNGYPARYVNQEVEITNQTKLKVRMSQGGGFVMRIYPKDGAGINNIGQKPTISISVDVDNQVLNIDSEKLIQSVRVFNVSGQLVLNDDKMNEDYIQQIDISNLKRGIYIVKVKTGSTVDSLKFIY